MDLGLRNPPDASDNRVVSQNAALTSVPPGAAIPEIDLMNEIGLPNRALERELRQAIARSLHELVPEFRTHVGRCPSCDGFHEWVTWKHLLGTNEWVATCPQTGRVISVSFHLGNA